MNQQLLFVSDWTIVEERRAAIRSVSRDDYSAPTLGWSPVGLYETGICDHHAEPFALGSRDEPPSRSGFAVRQEQFSVLLVEQRDEVFARIAGDLVEIGLHVMRATSADEALALAEKTSPKLVITNLNLPDQSGWLAAAKLNFINPEISMWLYQPQSSDEDRHMAQFLGIDELLDYGGDLYRLSDNLVELVRERLVETLESKSETGCQPKEVSFA